MRIIPVVLFAALTAFAIAATSARVGAKFRDDKADKVDAELKKLAGIWEIESATLAGRPFPSDPKARTEFRDSIQISFILQKAGSTMRIVTLDLSVDPKRITLTEAETKNGTLVPKADGQVARCVYGLDGDKLTIVQWRGPKPEFPKSLEPKAGDPVMMLELKRVKN